MKMIPFVNSDQVALVDDNDYEGVSEHRWRLRSDGYVMSSSRIGGKHLLLQCFILKIPKGLEIDHENHDPLDNRRENLRLATHAQNMANMLKPLDGKTSRFKGVCWHKASKKWQVLIGHEGKHFHLGLYKSEEEAARTYDLAALKYFRKFSRLNFPERITIE